MVNAILNTQNEVERYVRVVNVLENEVYRADEEWNSCISPISLNSTSLLIGVAEVVSSDVHHLKDSRVIQESVTGNVSAELESKGTSVAISYAE